MTTYLEAPIPNKKIKVEFITIMGDVFARGEYKTRKAMHKAKDRYDMQYGAILRTREVAS